MKRRIELRGSRFKVLGSKVIGVAGFGVIVGRSMTTMATQGYVSHRPTRTAVVGRDVLVVAL